MTRSAVQINPITAENLRRRSFEHGNCSLGTTACPRQQVIQHSTGNDSNVRQSKVPQFQSRWPASLGLIENRQNHSFKLRTTAKPNLNGKLNLAMPRANHRACRPRTVRPRLSPITATFTGPRQTSLFPKAARPAAPCATYCYHATSHVLNT